MTIRQRQPSQGLTDYPYDPTLAEHLIELKEICREIGAGGMWVIRQPTHVWISFEIDGEVKELRLPKSGTIFICRFTSTDGGDSGLV